MQGGSYEIIDGERVLKRRTKPPQKASPEGEKKASPKGGKKKRGRK